MKIYVPLTVSEGLALLQDRLKAFRERFAGGLTGFHFEHVARGVALDRGIAPACLLVLELSKSYAGRLISLGVLRDRQEDEATGLLQIELEARGCIEVLSALDLDNPAIGLTMYLMPLPQVNSPATRKVELGSGPCLCGC